MASDQEFRIWPARYKASRLEVHESADHFHWFSTAEVREILPGLRPDKYLQNAYGNGVGKLDKGPRLFFSENALMRELKRMRSKEALMFLGWLEANIIYPSQRKRGELPGIQHLKTRFNPEGNESPDYSESQHVVVPALPAVKKTRAEHHKPSQIERSEPTTSFLQNLLMHWRGQHTLVYAFFMSGLVMLVWTGVTSYALKAATDQSSYTGSYLLRQWAVLFLLQLMGAGWGWWAVGLMRSSLRAYHQGGRLLPNLLAYVAAFAFLLNAAGETLNGSKEWVEGWWDTVTDQLRPTLVTYDSVHERIVVKGEIGFGSYKELEAALLKNPNPSLIELESPGGFVFEGLAMARLVQSYGLDTVSFGLCASACTMVFAAGAERYLGPKTRVGFHRSWSYGRPLSKSWTPVDRQIADYYEERGMSPYFVKIALDTPGHSMWYPEHERMLAGGYATKQWRE